MILFTMILTSLKDNTEHWSLQKQNNVLMCGNNSDLIWF